MDVHSRVSAAVRDTMEEDFWRRLLAVAVVGGTVVGTALDFVSSLASTTILVVFAFFYIETLESQVLDFERELESFRAEYTGLRFFDGDNDYEINERLREVIDEGEPDTVVMVDYSSERGFPVLEEAIKRGAEVYLFVKAPIDLSGDDAVGSPDWTGDRRAPVNPHQQDKIIGQITSSSGGLLRGIDRPENLHVRFYEPDASVRVRLVDDTHASVGWYRFGRKERGAGIHGDDNPMVLVREEHPDYATVDSWLREDVLPDLARQSLTLRELLESDDCPAALTEWYGREYNRETREALVDAVSRHPPGEELPWSPLPG